MPGLYGAINLNHKRRENFFRAVSNCKAMEKELRHSESYKKQVYKNVDQGVFIGRIGLPDLCVDFSVQGNGKVRVVYGKLQQLEEKGGGYGNIAGFFSLATIDSQNATVDIVADKRASEPIYYRLWDDVLYFAPEAKALVKIADDQVCVNLSAFAALVGHGHLYGFQSLFSNISKLEGGSLLTIKDGKLSKQKYWEFDPGSKSEITDVKELIDELSNLVDESVLWAIGDGSNTAIFLSGGYDSRAILGSAINCEYIAGQGLQTVTWGTDESEDGTDAYIARQLSGRVGTEHIFFKRSTENYGAWFEEANHFIDAQSDVAAFHPQEFQLMRQLKEAGISRVVRGDEAFGWRHRAYNYASAFGNVRVKPFRQIQRIKNFINAKLYDEISEANDSDFQMVLKDMSIYPPNQAKDKLYFNHRLQTYLGAASYYKQILHEHFNPLVFDRILSFMTKVDDRLRVDKKLFKDVVCSRYTKFVDIPFSVKDGLEDWANLVYAETSVRKYLEKNVYDESSPVWGYFSKNAIQDIFRNAQPPVRPESQLSKKRIIYDWSKHCLKSLSPRASDYFSGKNALIRSPSNVEILMRFIVFKNWCDRYL